MNTFRILVLGFALPALLAIGCGDSSRSSKKEQQVDESTPPTIGHFLKGGFEVVAVFRDGELSHQDVDAAAIFTFRPKDGHRFEFVRADGSESQNGTFGSVEGHRLGFKLEFENGEVIQGRLSTNRDRNREFVKSTNLENPPSQFYLIGYMTPAESPAKSIDYCMKEGGIVLLVQRRKEEDNQ